MQDVKSGYLKYEDDLLKGFAVTYDSLDTSGEYFDKDTEFGFEKSTEIPLFYHHGMNGFIKKSKIGKINVRKTDEGLFFEAELDKRRKYIQEIQKLAKTQEGLGVSSGAVPHLIERERTNKGVYLKQWIIGEVSLTPTPAESLNVVKSLKKDRVLKAKEYYLKNKSLLNEIDEEPNNDYKDIIKMLNINNYL